MSFIRRPRLSCRRVGTGTWTCRVSGRLSQEFLERFPIVTLPTLRQVFSQTFGKARMVKNNLGPGTLLGEREFSYRVDARLPAAHTPSLHNSLVRHKFDVSPRDVPAEESERASQF